MVSVLAEVSGKLLEKFNWIIVSLTEERTVILVQNQRNMLCFVSHGGHGHHLIFTGKSLCCRCIVAGCYKSWDVSVCLEIPIFISDT